MAGTILVNQKSITDSRSGQRVRQQPNGALEVHVDGRDLLVFDHGSTEKILDFFVSSDAHEVRLIFKSGVTDIPESLLVIDGDSSTTRRFRAGDAISLVWDGSTWWSPDWSDELQDLDNLDTPLRMAMLEKSSRGFERRMNVDVARIDDELSRHVQQVNHNKIIDDRVFRYMNLCFLACTNALSGDIVLKVSADENLTAAGLNLTASGEDKRTFFVSAESANGTEHLLCDAILDLAVSHTTVDGDINDATIATTVTLVKGKATVDLTLDTDAGATKVYQSGDTAAAVTASFPGNSWLGYTVSGVTKTYNVV